VSGALASTSAEYDRRIAGPYEQTKVLENGDVFPATQQQFRESIAGLSSRLPAQTPEGRMQAMTGGAQAAKPAEVKSAWADDEARQAADALGGVETVTPEELGEWGKE
jgi:hypothetical protein